MTFYARRFYKPKPNYNQFNSANNRVCDPSLKQRLEKLLSNAHIGQYPKTKEFLQSLLEQFNSRGSLSTSQVRCLEDNEKRYSDDNLEKVNASLQAWQSSYDEDKRTKMRLIAKWYKDCALAGKQPYYYRETCEKVLSEDSYVPSEQSYEKIVNNKWAQRYLQERDSTPKFKNGDVVELNTMGKKNFSHFYDTGTFIVIEVTDQVRAVSGSRVYGLLPIGDNNTANLEERYLKISR